MITADQILMHLIGDYLLQSDWMAQQKTKDSLAAWVHATVYSFPFLIFSPSMLAWTVILGSHFLIDRYRLARYVVWAKNCMGPNRPWPECTATGYPRDRLPWMAVWLLIIADNTIHILVNGFALKFL
jgi:hypothetical protein